MRYSHLAAFEKHLESAGPAHFSPLYMVLAKDDFVRKEAYEKLISHLLGTQSAPLMSLCVYDDEKIDMDSVCLELNSLSFFSAKRVVVIHHVENLLKAATEKLIAYYENPNPLICLVLTATSILGTTSFYKKSELAGVILEIPEEKPWEKEKSLKIWIQQKVASYGKQIEPEASHLLLKQVGIDQATLSQEINKLVCYVGEKPRISSSDVYEICISLNIENVWQLGEAIFRCDAKTALRIALALIQEGTPLLILFRQIRSQFQTHFQVCSLLSQGGTGADITKQFVYMKGQILERHMQGAKNYGMKRFCRGLILIDEAELAIKNGATDYSFLMERLLIKLMISL